MKLRRDIASVPLRTGEETWNSIIGLITGPGTVDGAQLTAATSILAMIITDEVHSDKPMTLVGARARVVLYCTFGGNALILGEEIDPLPINPTANDWAMYVPCREEDLTWAGNTLRDRAPRIVLHDLAESRIDETSESSSSTRDLDVDWEALG